MKLNNYPISWNEVADMLARTDRHPIDNLVHLAVKTLHNPRTDTRCLRMEDIKARTLQLGKALEKGNKEMRKDLRKTGVKLEE